MPITQVLNSINYDVFFHGLCNRYVKRIQMANYYKRMKVHCNEIIYSEPLVSRM